MLVIKENINISSSIYRFKGLNSVIEAFEQPMSLFGDYIKQREGKDIIESDKGFATYSVVKDGIYIEDIFVSADHRHSGEAARMADQIADIAREKGLKRLYGSVSPSANNSTASLKVLLAYGFKLNSSTNNFIWMEKDL